MTVRSALHTHEFSGLDIDAINLRRLLIRLEQQIFVPGPDSRILHSSFERSKIAQNVEYARTLLLRLEHSTPSIKIQARKHAQQAELARQRALIKRLTERLYELNQRDDEITGGQTDEDEDILETYFAPEPAAVSSSMHSKDVSSTALPNTPIEGLRARNSKSGSTISSLPTKGPSTALADELFGRTSKSETSAFSPVEMSTGQQLEHQDSLQADLTSLLVKQAQQLKLGSLEFQQTLEEDEEARNRAEGAITKSSESMDIASRSMGALRKMSEGRWWWQRYIMFILIFVLWFVEIGIVFLGPKLRF